MIGAPPKIIVKISDPKIKKLERTKKKYVLYVLLFEKYREGLSL